VAAYQEVVEGDQHRVLIYWRAMDSLTITLIAFGLVLVMATLYALRAMQR
jgi:hypothetical protein